MNYFNGDFELVRSDSGEIIMKSDSLRDLLKFAEWFRTISHVIRYNGKIILTNVKES